MVQQFYQSEVNNEYVIRGNSAVLKCSIPSFVSDFVSVLSWQDENGNLYGSLEKSDENIFGTFSMHDYSVSIPPIPIPVSYKIFYLLAGEAGIAFHYAIRNRLYFKLCANMSDIAGVYL